MKIKMHELDYYSILRDCLDSILYMVKNTDNTLQNKGI